MERSTIEKMGKSTISMAIFNSYVNLPEGSMDELVTTSIFHVDILKSQDQHTTWKFGNQNAEMRTTSLIFEQLRPQVPEKRPIGPQGSSREPSSLVCSTARIRFLNLSQMRTVYGIFTYKTGWFWAMANVGKHIPAPCFAYGVDSTTAWIHPKVGLYKVRPPQLCVLVFKPPWKLVRYIPLINPNVKQVNAAST